MKREQHRQAEAIARMIYCNPFRPERIELEREALGADFQPAAAEWNLRNDWAGTHPNVALLREQAKNLVQWLPEQWGRRAPSARQREVFEGVALFHLFHEFSADVDKLVEASLDSSARNGRIGWYRAFREEADRLLLYRGEPLAEDYRPEFLFALFFQIRRAFFQIFRYLIGRSRPAARLRAAVWESIFTSDMRRYRHSLWERMGDMATLITGPSGTGKELVARAIGLSRFIPFDPKGQQFAGDFAGSFYPLNLSALSSTLIESELFGHRRGSFTGALQDRAGWLEVCPDYGTVFLDEIGEVDPQVQVKLLRVLQERVFSRIGETETRPFRGKIIAATNRDLAAEMAGGTFRMDFYYRLCSDLIETPSLQEQIADTPGELGHLVNFAARRVVGDAEGPEFGSVAKNWIRKNLGMKYPWPGNFRELEQCLRNLAIRGSYAPAEARSRPAAEDSSLWTRLEAGQLTADALMTEVCTRLYDRIGNYGEVARRLGVDRRTVRKYVSAGADVPGA